MTTINPCSMHLPIFSKAFQSTLVKTKFAARQTDFSRVPKSCLKFKKRKFKCSLQIIFRLPKQDSGFAEKKKTKAIQSKKVTRIHQLLQACQLKIGHQRGNLLAKHSKHGMMLSVSPSALPKSNQIKAILHSLCPPQSTQACLQTLCFSQITSMGRLQVKLTLKVLISTLANPHRCFTSRLLLHVLNKL